MFFPVVWLSNFLPFLGEYHFIVMVFQNLFICSSVDRHLDLCGLKFFHAHLYRSGQDGLLSLLLD